MAWPEFRKTKTGIAKKFNKKTGKWEAGSWYVIGRDRAGNRISEPAGAWENVKLTRRSVEALEGTTSTAVTVSMAYVSFENEISKGEDYSILTWPAYKRAMDPFIKYIGANTKLAAIKRNDLKKYIEKLRAEGYCQNGWLGQIGVVRAFLGFCVEWEHIDFNPASKITKGYKKIPVATPLTDDQVRFIRDCIDNPALVHCKKNWVESRKQFRDIVNFTLLTGLREAEVSSVQCAGVINRMASIIGKGSKERMVPLNDKAMEIYEKYADRGHPHIFEGWSPNRIKCQWMVLYKRVRALKPSFPKRCRFHDLRHTFASNFLRKTGDLKRLQMILGHSSIRTTADIYGHLLVDDLVGPMGNLPTAFMDEAPTLRVA